MVHEIKIESHNQVFVYDKQGGDGVDLNSEGNIYSISLCEGFILIQYKDSSPLEKSIMLLDSTIEIRK